MYQLNDIQNLTDIDKEDDLDHIPLSQEDKIMEDKVIISYKF